MNGRAKVARKERRTARGYDHVIMLAAESPTSKHLAHLHRQRKDALIMSTPTSPLRKAWYRWKSLKLPWRKRFLVGK